MPTFFFWVVAWCLADLANSLPSDLQPVVKLIPYNISSVVSSVVSRDVSHCGHVGTNAPNARRLNPGTSGWKFTCDSGSHCCGDGDAGCCDNFHLCCGPIGGTSWCCDPQTSDSCCPNACCTIGTTSCLANGHCGPGWPCRFWAGFLWAKKASFTNDPTSGIFRVK
jgi:hypothetical protein